MAPFRVSLRNLAATFLLVAATAAGQQIPPAEPAQEYSLSEPRFEKTVVATVGKVVISAQEFLLSYEFGPAFPKRENESKSHYLIYMIYEKLFALDGEAHKRLRSPEAKRLLAEIEADLATEELYRDKIAGRVHVTDSMIARGVTREGQHIVVQWLFEPEEERIAAAQRALANGASFDSLFTRQLNDTVKMDDRIMETTRFKLDRANPVLSAVADTLPFTHISLPIHAPDGWYLVRVTEGWGEPIVTESETAKRREDVHRALVQQISDSLSDRYVDSLMRTSTPVIQRKALDILEFHLATKVLPSGTYTSWKLSERLLQRWGKTAGGPIERHRKDILVTLKRGSFQVSDMLAWYDSREYNIKLPLTTPERFHTAVEQLVWRMVRDRLLTDKAMNAGLQRRKTVQRQKQWWREKIAYLMEKSSIQDSIVIPDDSLHQYYTKHPNDYRDQYGAVKPYVSVQGEVRKAWVGLELTKRMLRRIPSLKQKYKVTIHDDTLAKLYVDTENEPRAIDVYPVKKGGIFPHRAFPSINYEWQAWE